jgi:hypothetical protein
LKIVKNKNEVEKLTRVDDLYPGDYCVDYVAAYRLETSIN